MTVQTNMTPPFSCMAIAAYKIAKNALFLRWSSFLLRLSSISSLTVKPWAFGKGLDFKSLHPRLASLPHIIH